MTPDTEAGPEEPRTTTGTWLIAMHPELARLTTGRVVNEANEYVVPVIEAEAAALRESEVRAELRERVAGLLDVADEQVARWPGPWTAEEVAGQAAALLTDIRVALLQGDQP